MPNALSVQLQRVDSLAPQDHPYNNENKHLSAITQQVEVMADELFNSLWGNLPTEIKFNILALLPPPTEINFTFEITLARLFKLPVHNVARELHVWPNRLCLDNIPRSLAYSSSPIFIQHELFIREKTNTLTDSYGTKIKIEGIRTLIETDFQNLQRLGLATQETDTQLLSEIEKELNTPLTSNIAHQTLLNGLGARLSHVKGKANQLKALKLVTPQIQEAHLGWCETLTPLLQQVAHSQIKNIPVQKEILGLTLHVLNKKAVRHLYSPVLKIAIELGQALHGFSSRELQDIAVSSFFEMLKEQTPTLLSISPLDWSEVIQQLTLKLASKNSDTGTKLTVPLLTKTQHRTTMLRLLINKIKTTPKTSGHQTNNLMAYKKAWLSLLNTLPLQNKEVQGEIIEGFLQEIKSSQMMQISEREFEEINSYSHGDAHEPSSRAQFVPCFSTLLTVLPHIHDVKLAMRAWSFVKLFRNSLPVTELCDALYLENEKGKPSENFRLTA